MVIFRRSKKLAGYCAEFYDREHKYGGAGSKKKKKLGRQQRTEEAKNISKDCSQANEK
jgi:hypothetical protein